MTYDGGGAHGDGHGQGRARREPERPGPQRHDAHQRWGLQRATWTFTDTTGNYNNASGTVHDHINKATPTVVVSFPASPITYDANGHSAIATVTGVSGTLAVPANGSVTISYKKNATVFVGAPTDAASYAASAHFASSNSNYYDADSTVDAALTINRANTGTAVTSSLNPSTLNQSVTFKAFVSNAQTSPIPTGYVQFKIDNSNFGVPVLLSGGMASVSTSSLTAGNHVVVADYLLSADGNFNNSSGNLSADRTFSTPSSDSSRRSQLANP